ncbi:MULTISPECIES: acetyltransferase [Agrobacterium]|uniref:Acetyltransferase n=1 Tax=Agrobacterium tumefaciens TaxID=358 RepID=A0AAE6EFS6_AGRTU|nr:MULTISPECIES: acetyltransferase [Agrobacterium]QCL75024.1 acetyltransferase [Agrobacterium tumefaciens]QCL80584.1 acetyltransferase [Agrobacterium tumefaciens]CUX63262.1 putative Transferase [Agrobacterium sp. NCPPB 925]
MTRPLILFGTGEIAELAHFYFTRDSDHHVVAFCVDGSYLREDHFQGLPVLAFEEVSAHFAPETHAMFVALAYAKLNDLRAEKVAAAEAAGYELTSYVSSRATVLNDGHFGPNAFVLENNTIQPFATIGRNVTLWSGNHIGHHSTIGDNVFISSHVVVSGGVTIGENCFIGVNSTLRDHVTVGARCVLGAGTVVLADMEAGGVYSPTATERSRVPSSRLRTI